MNEAGPFDVLPWSTGDALAKVTADVLQEDERISAVVPNISRRQAVDEESEILPRLFVVLLARRAEDGLSYLEKGTVSVGVFVEWEAPSAILRAEQRSVDSLLTLVQRALQKAFPFQGRHPEDPRRSALATVMKCSEIDPEGLERDGGLVYRAGLRVDYDYREDVPERA